MSLYKNEKAYVLRHLENGEAPQDIWTFICLHPNDFILTRWSLAKVHRFRVLLEHTARTVPARPQDNTGDFFNIVHNRGFGVEIEMLSRLSKREVATRLRNAGISVVVEDRSERAYRQGDWKITDDGSLSDGGMELVSPILKGEKGIEELKKVCKILIACRARIDVSCGLHVHHQVSTSGVDDLKILQNAMYVYHKYQTYINRMLPKSRRFAYTCHPHTNENIKEAFSARDVRNMVDCQDRYRAVNVRAYTRHGTCEFRQHSGSVEADKIAYWVIITQAIMMKAIELAKTTTDAQNYSFKRDLVEEMKLRTEIQDYINNRVAKFENKKAA